jgi:hypothetical protein
MRYGACIYSLVTLAIGCASPAYKEAEQSCLSEAYAKYPVRNETRIEEQVTPEMVQTGTSTCTTTGHTSQIDHEGNTLPAHTPITTCTPDTQLQHVSHRVPVTVDKNEAERKLHIKACAQSKCHQSHGNADCE